MMQATIDHGRPTLPIDIMPMPTNTLNASPVIKTRQPSAKKTPIATAITAHAMAVFLACVLGVLINTLFILEPFRRGIAPAIGLKLTFNDKLAATNCEGLVELGTAEVIHHRIAIGVEAGAECFGGD